MEFGYPTQRFVLPREDGHVSGAAPPFPFRRSCAAWRRWSAAWSRPWMRREAAVERIDREYRGGEALHVPVPGEIDPHEMFQNELALRQIDGSGAFAVKGSAIGWPG